MKWLVSLYSELQVNKHVHPEDREKKLTRWAAPLAAQYPVISIWEFCAAAGSTLGEFLLFAAAKRPGLAASEADALLDAYFPWVCGLHILLDYFIDAEEDRQGGDFNFTGYYRDAGECAGRLSLFVGQTLLKCSTLRFALFHETVLRGLLAMYLSDRKARSGLNRRISRKLIRCGGGQAVLYWNLCRAMRALGKL
jgi:tetraprenyl-beta-curcumene synthase